MYEFGIEWVNKCIWIISNVMFDENWMFYLDDFGLENLYMYRLS